MAPQSQFKIHQAVTYLIALLIAFCSYFLIKIDRKIDAYTDQTNELKTDVAVAKAQYIGHETRILTLEGNVEAMRRYVNNKYR